MPSPLHELVSPKLQAEYCYKKAKLNRALENPDSVETDILYQMVGRELAQINPPLILPYVEVCISPQCTLKCRDCANFMQHYHKPKPMDLEVVKSWIVGLLEAADHILTLRVMGGEPLMQKKLPELMEWLLPFSQLQHIQIVTNGTLKPKEELLNLMSGKTKCSFFFSNYGSKLAPHYQEYVQTCLDHRVLVQTVPADISWYDMGGTESRNLTPEQQDETYRKCPNNCRHIWNGELHHCPRSAHAKYLGLITDMPQSDYVSLLEGTPAERREKLRKFYELPSITACNHCGFAHGVTLVPCAVQVTSDHKRKK